MARRRKMIRVFGENAGPAAQRKFLGNCNAGVKNKKKLLGIGLDGNKCILTVVNVSGNITATEKIEISPLSLFKGKRKELKHILEKISAGTSFTGETFHSAGIAVAEKMSRLNGKSGDILARGIKRLFNCDVLLVREATAAGYGEKESGKHSAKTNMLYLHSDVGAGVMMKNEMFFEEEPDDDKGSSRRYLSSWEQFDIVATAKKLVDKGVGTDIVNMVSGNTDNITLETVLKAAEKNDELADDLVKRSGLALGVRTAYLVNMFNPEIVILGGGTRGAEGIFARGVKESMKPFLLKERIESVEIVPATLGSEASSIGAALLCRRELSMEGQS